MVTATRENKRNKEVIKPHGMANPVRKRLYTLNEAAEYLGLSTWGVRELIWAGEIPVVRRSKGRKLFVDILDLEDFIARNKSTYI